MCRETFFIKWIIIVVIYANGVTETGSDKVDHRLYGGKEAKEGTIPYIVRLIIAGDDDGHAVCGSSAISSNHLLTAAHCVDSVRSASDVIAIAGKVNYCNNKRDGFFTRAQLIYIHSEYTWKPAAPRMISYTDNDIAVITLQDRLPSSIVRPVALSPYEPRLNSICTLSGWGLTMNDPNISGEPDPNTGGKNISPCILRTAQIPVVSQNCKLFNKATQFCAGYAGQTAYNKHEHANGCQGDSGGPLVCNNLLQGIVSYGSIWCDPRNKSPGSFMKVNKYYQWIYNIITLNNPRNVNVIE